MTNIIICSNSNKLTLKIKNILKKTYINVKTISFSNFTLDLQNIIHSKNRVIYILFIDKKDSESIKIAQEIRKNDFQSILIFIISHELSAIYLAKKKFMFLTLISLYDNFEKELLDSISIAFYVLENKDIITISNNKEICFINKKDLLYINSVNKKSYIHLSNKTIETTFSLKELSTILNCNFIQTHKSCYINLDNIYKIDLLKNKIIFKNSYEITLLSRKYKKELKEKFNSN